MTIGELYDVCAENEPKKVVAVVGSKRKMLSGSWYVMDETCFWCKGNRSTVLASQIINAIEYEATDECWNPVGFRKENTYENCNICFLDGDDYDDFDTESYFIKKVDVTEKEIRLIC